MKKIKPSNSDSQDKAVKKTARRTNVEAANLKFQTDGHHEIINIYVRPVLHEEDTARGFLLVLFERAPETAEAKEQVFILTESVARQLEEELERVKSQLHSSLEQFENQTEELRSSSEELVTSRKEAEKSLLFKAQLLDTVEQSVIATDLDGTVIYWNHFAEKLYGWTAAEAVGRSIMELTPPRMMAQQAAEIMNKLRRGKSWAGEFQVQRRDGTTFPAHVINSPIEDGKGKVIGIVGVTVNLSERRKTEEALRESEERLRLLVESATDYAIFTITKDNLVDSWNSGAEKVFGFEEKEIVGKSCAILFTPEDRAAGVPEKEMKTAAAKGRAEDERWHIRKDNSRFYASGVMTPLKDGKGFVKIARDMTANIKIEQALQDKEILQKLVGAQEQERKRIARDLHDELGQKLTALRFKLEAVGKMCEDVKICGKINEIESIAKQIDADVDFLAWELRPAALDDLGLLATLANYVGEWSRHSGVAAEFHAVGMKNRRLAPEVETNLYRITQEALNNSYKHARAKQVNVMLEKRKDSIVLIIEDNGKGFSPKDKINRSKGIGLTGMRERAALVGGTLEIESAAGEGTTIFARVPFQEEETTGSQIKQMTKRKIVEKK